MPTDQAGLGARVREALELSFMDESGLARAIGLDPDDLVRSLDGIRDFDTVEVAQIAETLSIPVHFLLGSGSLTRSLAIAARTRPASNGAPIRHALARCDTIVDLDDLLNELGYRESLVIPRIERSQYATGPAEEGNDAAQRVRRYLSPEDQNCDIVDLIPAIERLGIDVIIEPLDRHLDGLAITSGAYRAMLVNTRIPPTRRLYTIAHELAHLILGDSDSRFSGDIGRQSHVIVDEDVQGRSIYEEMRANYFAAELLMPAAAIRNIGLTKPLDHDSIDTLLRRFGVSRDALAFRLHNLGMITGRDRNYIRSQTFRMQPDVPVIHPPKLLLARALDAYEKGDLGAAPIANLYRTDLNTILQQLAPLPPIPDAEDSSEELPVL